MESFIIEMVFAAIVTLLATPRIARYLKASGIMARDQHKRDKPLLPTSGGIPVFFGFYLAVSLYIFLRVYYFGDMSDLLPIMAVLLSTAIITVIGFLDDIRVNLGSNQERIGLKQWQKPLLTLVAAIPLMALKVGNPSMSLPLIGLVNVGILYPLVFVPVGVMGAANMVNLLAGLNGLETGMAIVYLGSLAYFAFLNSTLAAKVIAFAGLGAALGFYYWNKFPAKVLPGDSLTYFFGALLANLAIIGNMEKVALVISIPFFFEFALKLRGKLKQPTVGTVNRDKILKLNEGIYSLPHFWMKGKHTEKQVVFRICVIIAVFSVLAWFV
ncbi:MAG: hypothetical protein GOU99_02340 [Candidatus Altiarchaeota archaeon]|nr:hypothetical protein [Candidatus Altiarchaeota archaeon]